MDELFEMLTLGSVRVIDARGVFAPNCCWIVEVGDENGDICEVLGATREAAIALAIAETTKHLSAISQSA